ncbi:polysaccharide pyruvyl transferase family protein [Ferrimonas balearica]|uniref:polysaccharide pyruvyl transferase family protein n=1 Tax=Ferrimonas balearica TaxID=44012 RepID=UPI001C59188A|nr:polysaccharide pyruvyl transferase family protein [Ferrimonas balearica]MBY6105255.1 polysaccharide pyruvyl transferase family protein [Ferrimonas balearica]MBY6225105.1 polysaccharide pyruvyl transferase family protein [Ferrimonas balearica]
MPQSILSLLSNEQCIRAWYFTHVVNIGDLAGPYLIEKITGKKVVPSILGLRQHIISVGSIFSQANNNSLIWGAGLISKHEKIHVTDGKNISMVRGQFTKRELEARGLKLASVALSDPASLLPTFYSPKISKKYKVGIIPHYVDYDGYNKQAMPEGVKLIDVKADVESFIDELLECETIISSSLHGIIISDCYCIPNIWIGTHNQLSGDDFKFYDYFSNFKEDVPVKMSLDMGLSNLNSVLTNRSVRVNSDTVLANALEAFPL